MWRGTLTGKQQQGRYWEEQALAFLQARSLVLVEANFSCRVGEIDLIMQDGDTLAFVEVRQRDDPAYGGAAASISPAKIRRLVRAAQFFLLRYERLPPCRFDVVAIDGSHMEWLRNVIEM